MKLTDELLRAACPGGAWTKAQLAVLGITYPLQTAWKQRVIGKEISDEDYQRLCELASVRVKPKKERPEIPEQPAAMDADTVIAWLDEKLAVERVARVELETKISVLQFRLDALCNGVMEARSGPTSCDSSTTGTAPALPQKPPTSPPWKV